MSSTKSLPSKPIILPSSNHTLSSHPLASNEPGSVNFTTNTESNSYIDTIASIGAGLCIIITLGILMGVVIFCFKRTQKSFIRQTSENEGYTNKTYGGT